MNEDPFCLRAYPDWSQYPTYTARDGECVRVGPGIYARYKVGQEGADYSKYFDEEKNEDNHETLDEDEDEDEDYDSRDDNKSKDMKSSGSGQGFSMEGDGYSMSVKMDNDE